MPRWLGGSCSWSTVGVTSDFPSYIFDEVELMTETRLATEHVHKQQLLLHTSCMAKGFSNVYIDWCSVLRHQLHGCLEARHSQVIV